LLYEPDLLDFFNPQTPHFQAELASKYVLTYLKQVCSGIFPPSVLLKAGTGFLFLPAASMALTAAVVTPANTTETTHENRLLKNLK